MDNVEKTIIEQAKEIKKTAGKEAALDFLFTSKVSVTSDLVGYLDRIKIYATGSQKYSPQIILNFFDQVIAKMIPEDIWQGYNQKAEMLGRYGLMKDAKNNYSSAISNISPATPSYLFNLYMLERKFASLCTDKVDNVYWSIVSQLHNSAWDLQCEMMGKVESWLRHSDNMYASVYKTVKPSFMFYLGPINSKSFSWNCSNFAESLNEFNPSIPADIYKGKIIKLITVDYPRRLGFKQEYFKSDYNDSDFYNEILALWTKDFDEIFPKKAVNEATELVNEFLKEIQQ